MIKAKKSYSGWVMLSAMAASLCCITPVFALVAGLGGLASSFIWLEPFRPYLIALTSSMLAFGWYQKLKIARSMDCSCQDKKTPFLQTRAFLGIVTVFAGIMLAFPYYAHIFQPDRPASRLEINQDNLTTAEFSISGMTCAGCEVHITQAVNKLEGIQSVDASYDEGKVKVRFDKARTDQDAIIQSIHTTGYKVIN